MLKIDELRELIKLVDESNLTEFKLKNDDLKITLRKGSIVSHIAVQSTDSVQQGQPAPTVVPQAQVVGAAPLQQPQAEEEPKEDHGLHKIVSPMVGTFYAASAPDAPPYVQVGDKVTESSVVCIVEAMKLMNEIEAEINGTIVEVLVENGQLVEYGQPLFLVKAE